MSRKTTATATKPARTRQAKPAVEEPAYSPKELELRQKYGHQDIQAGSWRHAGHPDRKGLGDKKATVVVKCSHPAGCDQSRIVCTSDLQWRTTCFCPAHAKQIKSNRKATKEAKKELK